MRNPFWRLKTLPWITLLQAAGLVVAIATVADLSLTILWTALLNSDIGRLETLLRLVALVLPLAMGYGMGAMAILVMERLFKQVYLDTAVLWALVPCIALVLFLKASLLPIPTLLVLMGYPQVVGVVLGIFVTGKRYW
jgi:predicted membrane-bound spermidine synthase